MEPRTLLSAMGLDHLLALPAANPSSAAVGHAHHAHRARLGTGHHQSALQSSTTLAANQGVHPLFRVIAGTVNPHRTTGGVTNPSPRNGAETPSKIQQAYGFNQITLSNGTGGTEPGDGTGQTIAIVDAYDDPNIVNDLATFDSQWKLPTPSLTKYNETGVIGSYPSKDPSGGWELEESLDVEWAHAMAPKANIALVEANTTNTNDLLAAVKTAAAHASVVSMSWGGGEFNTETSNDSSFSQPGVTFVASSGDSGAPASWPAISPNVVAVGGTTLKLDSNNNWSSETGWSGSGGGVSSYESQPSYQNGVVPSTISTTQRTNPDTAYNADPNTGFAVYDSVNYYPYYPYTFGAQSGWFQVGGTSAGAPQWSALLAIANQGRQFKGEAALNGGATPNPREALSDLYNPAAAADFHDITSGTSTGTPNYTAGQGYDAVTGIGSPKANQVVQALVTPPTVAAPTLTATADPAGPIMLSWNAVTGATAYDVYIQGNSTPLIANTTATTAYNTVAPGTTNTYYVVAKNSAGSTQSNIASATANPHSLFSDSFNPPSSTFPTTGWAVAGTGGSWSESSPSGSTDGVLSQTSTATGDPKKAVNTSVTYASANEEMITAKVRIDSWQDGEYARAGVGLMTNSSTGQGYNLVVRDRNNGSRNTIQFFNDGVGWGNSYTLAAPLQVGTWYDFSLMDKNGALYGNVWQDGTTEPATWQYVQSPLLSNWTLTSGSPALNGGASGTFSGDPGPSSATASFDNVSVTGG